MACCGPTLLTELKDLVGQIGSNQCCAPCQVPCCDGPLLSKLNDLVGQIGNNECNPCCPPPTPCCAPCCQFPFAQVVMTCPPPILAPTRPEPVKPLMIRCPEPPPDEMSMEQRDILRYDNFYNNYNIDWHDRPEGVGPLTCDTHPPKKCGVTVDGKSPCSNCPKKVDCCCAGCPTGFKPCTMKLCPPPGCHPLLPWCAEIQPCSPRDQLKKKKKQRKRASCGTCG